MNLLLLISILQILTYQSFLIFVIGGSNKPIHRSAIKPSTIQAHAFDRPLLRMDMNCICQLNFPT